MQQQINLFEESTNLIKDVRTEQQTNKKIAYDVGTRLSGSRKEEARIRREFEQSNSVETLSELEELGAVIAAEMVTKQQVFKSFSLDSEKDKGTSPVVARVKQLIIQRIDSHPSIDSPEARKSFLAASLKFKEILDDVKNEDEYISAYGKLGRHLSYESSSSNFSQKMINKLQEELKQLDPEDCSKYEAVVKDLSYYESRLKQILQAKQEPMCCLGDKFVNFFTKRKSADKTWETVLSKVSTWDDLLAKKTVKSVQRAKPLWERTFPERPDRVGGRQSSVLIPEDLMNAFQFKAVEFGNYVSDEKGNEHILRASEAFFDLSDVIGIEDYSIAINASLGMAFGSRGRGKALGTYDPKVKVINLTKDRGCTGVLAHEWFHHLDCHLLGVSHSHKNGIVGFMSQIESIGPSIDSIIVSAFESLMSAILEGTSVAYYQNTNDEKTRYRVNSTFINTYKRNHGDLFKIMSEFKEKEDRRRSHYLSMYIPYGNTREEQKNKLVKAAERNLKKHALALAWFHEDTTGERVESIPYPSSTSQFFQPGLTLDKGKVGKYWSAPYELAARAFEAYIADRLKEMKRKNDYLVYATGNGIAFPVGEERININQKFDVLFECLRENKIL
ncbi:LPD1 domain-containing protein [Metabacillus herbersteinensis]|uniref:LPD1 domain-containing protein n=1 Tax=Metabacillus herbersteinensis TaxID=283816 RepID=A0ABV6GJ90_9BACI